MIVLLCLPVLQRRRSGGLPAGQPATERGHDTIIPEAAGGGDASYTRQGHRAPRPQAPEHTAHTQRGAASHAPSC